MASSGALARKAGFASRAPGNGGYAVIIILPDRNES